MRVLSSEIIKCVRTRKPSSCLKWTKPIWESSGASETRQGKEQSSEAVSPTPWSVLRVGPPAQWEPYPGMGIPILSLASFPCPSFPWKAGSFVLVFCAPVGNLPHLPDQVPGSPGEACASGLLPNLHPWGFALWGCGFWDLVDFSLGVYMGFLWPSLEFPRPRLGGGCDVTLLICLRRNSLHSN